MLALRVEIHRMHRYRSPVTRIHDLAINRPRGALLHFAQV